MKSMLAQMTNACKARHADQDRTKTSSRSSEHRFHYRLHRRIRFTSRKAKRSRERHAPKALELAGGELQASPSPVLPHVGDGASAFPGASSRRYPGDFRCRPEEASPTPDREGYAGASLAQAHYRFNFRSILNTSWSAPVRGGVHVDDLFELWSHKNNLGGSEVFRCRSCLAVFDRDVNAARNIFHKNIGLLL
ncbi:LOW QUALITY PROTEIN: hypothetical protein PHMEG_0005712 [Phytophthora megakarya]|uniref:Uncharacterized protein n=1 Tax=Phytophthora megakarya TaxID=4795 RepID=A0A225WQU2_9STRA|nr:LOW QUALITY PROTEIN: hypothetical protein PHMEG_0005712 [Phytophthora megakarya]